MMELNTKYINTIDLNFREIPGAIASYLVPHSQGVVLIECGPGSTLSSLRAGLRLHGYDYEDITDVLLTHIHLDHAGAAGRLAQYGANIYVHPVGAPHMLNPEKLIASASRIYGDMMEVLWGEFLPVPAEKLLIPKDNDVININELSFQALDTPGHARHHYAYIHDNICFSGDIGGVRLSGTNHLRIPMPPPEFVLEDWQRSVSRIMEQHRLGHFDRIAPTHFGVFTDPEWHLDALLKALNQINGWLGEVMPNDPSVEELNQMFLTWTRQRAIDDGTPEEKIEAYEAANPSWMSGYGIQRYWHKYRQK